MCLVSLADLALLGFPAVLEDPAILASPACPVFLADLALLGFLAVLEDLAVLEVLADPERSKLERSDYAT